MTADPILLDKYERTRIILHADLRGALPDVTEGTGEKARSRSVSPSTAKAVLFVLDSFLPERCYPGEDYLAPRACTTPRTLRRTIASLIAGDLVSTSPRPVKSHRGHANRFYHVHYHRLALLDPNALHAGDAEPGAAPGASPGQGRPTGKPGAAPGDAQGRPPGPPTTNKRLPEGTPGTTDERRREVELAVLAQRLAPALVVVGVHPNAAAGLVRDAGSEERVLEVLAMLREASRREHIPNPGGWLNRAIRRNWKPATQPEGATA